MRQRTMVLIAGCLGTVLLGGRTPAVSGAERTTGPVVSLCPAEPAAVQSRPAGAPRQRYDAGTGVTFSTGRAAQGRAIVKAEAAGFSFEKTVSPSGETLMRIAVGKDVVSISLGATALSVTRGQATVTLDPRAPGDEEVERLHRLLAGSKAVRAVRALAAHYESLPPADDDVFSTSTLIDGAVVGFLSGDPGAMPRIARRLVARRTVSIQRAKFRGQDRYTDCWSLYENTVDWAMGEYTGCVREASDDSWLIRGINMDYCGVVWLMRAEGAWFQLGSCMAIPR